MQVPGVLQLGGVGCHHAAARHQPHHAAHAEPRRAAALRLASLVDIK